jgi:putative sterol carrier protein
MNAQELTTFLKGRAAEMPVMDLSIKLNLKGDGIIHVNSRGTENVVSNEDLPADCTVTITPDNFQKLIKGKLNPMMAVMTGKLKIDGDMSVAMKLQSLFGKK